MNKSTDGSDKVEMLAIFRHLQAGNVVMALNQNHVILMCDADATKAVDELLQVANINPGSDKVLLVQNISRIQAYTSDFPEVAWDLMELSEKPIFLLTDNIKNVSAKLILPSNDIAFGTPSDTKLKNLCTRVKKPLFCIYIFNGTPKINIPEHEIQNMNIVDNGAVPSKIKISRNNQIKIIRN